MHLQKHASRDKYTDTHRHLKSHIHLEIRMPLHTYTKKHIHRVYRLQNTVFFIQKKESRIKIEYLLEVLQMTDMLSQTCLVRMEENLLLKALQ